MTIVREFTRERDGVSARIVVSTVSDGFQAVVKAYRGGRSGADVLEAHKGAQRVTLVTAGSISGGSELTPYVQERLTHNVPISTEYHMSLVAMRFLGILSGRTEEGKNIWGTDLTLINPDEFCPMCERERPGHYSTCPEYRK